MTIGSHDWKDHSNAQFSKAVALAITLMLFAFLITAKVDTHRSRENTVMAEMTEAPPDERQKEEDVQEQEIQVDIPVFSEELATDASPELREQRLQALKDFGDIQSTTSSSLQSGGDDKPFDFVPYEDSPVPLGRISPVYPDFAKRAGVQGTVMLAVDVYKDGSVGNIRVLKSVQSGPGGLDEAAVNAIRGLRFQPGKSGGNAIDTTVNIPVEFKLN
ncbi:MAG: energy transducer TonB [Candidatus Cloacimonetes bacterium]|nr:energy transducer TonB [Candidatus Cloacimonadota bacterium]